MALDPDLYSFAIHTLRMYPRFAEASDGRVPPEVGVFDVNNTVNFRLANAALPEAIPVGSFFDVQAIVEMAGLVSDRFGDDEIGGRFVFEVPSFPHCFPLADGNPGGNVPVSYEKLLPETEIHALLGPDLVVDGVLTDADGAGEIQLPLPSDTEAGLHLVTIGHDGLALTADCTVEVVACEDDDLDPPHIDGVEAAPAMLWPPNHKMVSVEITPDAGDVCDSDPACEIVSVSSNEPVNGKGDGNTSPDWDITGDLTVDLRAERSGKGSGRIYTVEIQCTDASGQTANETTEVTVAHDQGGAKNTPMAAVKSKKTR
jgi:hypothetical protein